jgi:hypothetical protein
MCSGFTTDWTVPCCLTLLTSTPQAGRAVRAEVANNSACDGVLTDVISTVAGLLGDVVSELIAREFGCTERKTEGGAG